MKKFRIFVTLSSFIASLVYSIRFFINHFGDSVRTCFSDIDGWLIPNLFLLIFIYFIISDKYDIERDDDNNEEQDDSSS